MAVHQFDGRHLLLNLVGCEGRALDDAAVLEAEFRAALAAAGASVVEVVSHRFEPRGATIVALLRESHASVHTYPEHAACFIDLFTCGAGVSPERFEAHLVRALEPARVHREVARRDATGSRLGIRA